MSGRVTESALAACRAEPHREDLALKAIQTALLYPDETAFAELSDWLWEKMHSSHEVVTALGLADLSFGRFEAAERSLLASLELRHDERIEAAIAEVQIRLSRPQDAWPTLQTMLSEHWVVVMRLLLLTTECYQGWGLHEDALSFMDQCEANAPELANQPEWTRQRAISERNRRTGKKIRSPFFRILKSAVAPTGSVRS